MKLLSILTENKISYSAVVLDDDSKMEILKRVPPPKGWKIINHHMTIKLGELPESLKSKIGQTVELIVDKVGLSEKAFAIQVKTDISQNNIPHITVAVNSNNGGKPKDSNLIEKWEDIRNFVVKGTIQEVTNQSNQSNTITTLNVFDFDGTLIDSPTPEVGKQMYKQITGINYPHKGWWGQLDSLSPFNLKPLSITQKYYSELKNKPNSLTILMTNRLAKFEDIIKEKIKGIYDFDMLNFKTNQKEKPERIIDILEKYPTINTINIFDDMDEQINLFNEFKKNYPNLNINITQIKKGED